MAYLNLVSCNLGDHLTPYLAQQGKFGLVQCIMNNQAQINVCMITVSDSSKALIRKAMRRPLTIA
jgi:hypothetical protein